MNLLRIQDALKNASDQQLMQMMQAPDSTAPSYLVLSEIRRRKDMRAKQAPQESSSRTVAEDLTAPEDQGIRGMQMPGEPPQDVADQAGIEAMREGGVVRMQAGGQSPVGMPQRSVPPSRDPRVSMPIVPGNYDFGLSEQLLDTEAEPSPDFSLPDFIAGRSVQELRDIIARGTPNLAFGQRSGVSPGAASLAEAARERLARLEGSHQSTASLPVFSGEEGGLQGVLPTDRAQSQQPTTTATTTTTTTQPQTQTQPPAPSPARVEQRPRPPAGGTPAAAVATEANAPTLADIYRQNQGLFADGIGALRERAQQERVDPAARRSEAVNMALIEAGLRIAGSRNPSLVGAIGEGALPAVQSYGQQLGQIRAEQREARRDELELAKQELNRQFAVGQISATEYRTRMDNITRMNIADRQERMAGARAAEADARADRRIEAQGRLQADELRRRGYYTTEELAAMSPQQRALVQEQRSMGRPADTAGAGVVLNATMAEIGRIRTEMDNDPAPRPTSSGYAEWQRRDAARRQRLESAEQRQSRLEDILYGGRQPGGRTATGGGQGSGISQFGG